MRKLVLVLLLLSCLPAPSSAGGVTLSIQAGLVSLDAQDVTVREILAEWARVGKTRIVNVERITGGPITLKFTDVPEKQALDIVLRTIPGYVALPRATPVSDSSVYERILIMATTTVVAAPRPQPPAAGFPAQPTPGIPNMWGAPGGANATQLRPNPPAPLSPGTLPESTNSADDIDDPAIAAAAAAGLVPIAAPNPGPTAITAPLTAPGDATQTRPAQPTPGVGAPTNPWNATTLAPQPGLAAPAPPPNVQVPPPSRVRPPQPDR